jgi:hypothetical protein
MSCELTIITAFVRLTKIHILKDGKLSTEGYERAKNFNMERVRVGDLDDIERVLKSVQSDYKKAVLRGRPIVSGVSRRSLRGENPTLEDVDRRWLCVDIDELPWSGALNKAAIDYARNTLPDWLRSAECIAKWSASAGIRSGIRLHLWYFGDRPVSGNGLKHHLKEHCDISTLSAAQIHYTAFPICVGFEDPIRERIVRCRGESLVFPQKVLTGKELEERAELRAEENRNRARKISYKSSARSISKKHKYALSILKSSIGEIEAAPTGSRHRVIFAATCKVAGLVKAGLLDRDALTAVQLAGEAVYSERSRSLDVARIVEDAINYANPENLEHVG